MGLRRMESSSASVYTDMKARILRLDLTPGAQISESDIAAHYGVSRTPIREAIQRLASEGLVDVFAKSGTYVSRIPLAQLPEAIIVRKALEEATVRHATQRASESRILELRAKYARQKEAADEDDLEAFHLADDAFHATIATIAGFPGIWKLIENAKMQVDRYRRLTLPHPGRIERVIREHGAILVAIEAGDEAAAIRAMGDHIDALELGIDNVRSLNPDFFQ